MHLLSTVLNVEENMRRLILKEFVIDLKGEYLLAKLRGRFERKQ